MITTATPIFPFSSVLDCSKTALKIEVTVHLSSGISYESLLGTKQSEITLGGVYQDDIRKIHHPGGL
jgi:hypothetical protein